MDIESNYEISRAAEFIHQRNFNRVALQFPDELLQDSPRVVRALRERLETFYDEQVKLYVMADTTYGSCCVDEVGASHVNADCVIHYGHTCLSPTSTLPALFAFGKAVISVPNCVSKLCSYGQESEKPIVVLFGLEYAHAVPKIKEALSSELLMSDGLASKTIFADVICSVSCPSGLSKTSDEPGLVDEHAPKYGHIEQTSTSYSIGGLTWNLPEGHRMEDYLIFWIGLDNTAFANVVLTFNHCEMVRYDATGDCLVTDFFQQKRILKRRYYLVEKAKDANIIGILVGTLGVAGYLHMIHQMKELIARAGKKAYTFVMGKPNPGKLANFPECDVFIHVSCPQTALLDSKEFLAPVITPFEAVLALDRASQWTGEYVMEFRDLVASAPSQSKKQSEEARFSFLQGGYVEDVDLEDTVEAETDGVSALVNTTEKALRLRDKDSQSVTKGMAKSGAEYFAARSYHGLDVTATNSGPESFSIGRSGKASGYSDEKSKEQK